MIAAKRSAVDHDHIHQFKYTESDVARLCRESRLELLESGSYNFLPRNELRKALGPLASNRPVLKIINALDKVLTAIAPKMATNLYFIARRPNDPQ